MRRHSLIVAILVAAVSTTLVGLSSVPASAATTSATYTSAATTSATAGAVGDTGMEFSTDGTTWSQLPPSTLFDPNFKISPGDTEKSVLYVRSTRDEPTTLSLGIGKVTTDNAQLSAALTISASAKGQAGLSSAALDLAKCTTAGQTTVVKGESIPIDVNLALASSLQHAQAQQAKLSFVLNVTLADKGAPVANPGCDKPGTSIPAFDGNTPFRLAFTGTNSLYPALIIAGVVFGLGCLFVLFSRRRRERKSPQEARE